MHLQDDIFARVSHLMEDTFQALRPGRRPTRLSAISRLPRTPGYRPGPEDNAWWQ